jgi:hypothetical protein
MLAAEAELRAGGGGPLITESLATTSQKAIFFDRDERMWTWSSTPPISIG